MNTYIQSIKIAFSAFPAFAVFLLIPMLYQQIISHQLNVVRLFLNITFLLYILCVFALVIFPLPTLEQAARLSTHTVQPIPFHFIIDIIHETPFVLTDPSTYIPALTQRAVTQFLLNILMMVPFGLYLTYVLHCDMKEVFIYTLLFSLFIEIMQLSGLFFIFKGSYRLCDIDDILANTIGGLLGWLLITNLSNCLPLIEQLTLNFELGIKIPYLPITCTNSFIIAKHFIYCDSTYFPQVHSYKRLL